VPDAPADEPATEPVTDAQAAEREPTRVPLPLIGVIAGLMVGAGIVAVLAITGFFKSEASSPHAVSAFISAYERSRDATYALDGDFSRTLVDGRRLESGALIVQRPPDELRRQLGSTSGRLNGHRVNCTTDPAGQFSCAPGAEVGSWDQMVAYELNNLRTYFDPEHQVYVVRDQGGGCFELKLVASLADPPYGVRTVMCFDAATGAMRSIELEHPNGAIDRLEAAAIRRVTAADFDLTGNDAYASHEGGG
jgi:hypothetical protein